MSTAIERETFAAPTFGRLCTTELRRFFARRFTRLTLILAAVGYLAVIGLLWHNYAKVGPADTAQATSSRDRLLTEIAAARAECAKSIPATQVDEQCGPVPTVDDFPIDQFLTRHPFTPTVVTDTATGLGVATAAIGFVLGATFIGAEWSSRNIVAWLFWEPRRLRLLGAKVLALLSVLLAISAVVQLTWAVAGRALLHYRGVPVSTLGPRLARHFSTDLATLQIRAGLVVVVSALLAFGLAHLLRNTAAAFGFGFLYFAVFETLIRGVRVQWSPYLLTNAIAAWIQRRGIDIYLPQRFDRNSGQYTDHVVHLSNQRGGVTLLVYAGVVAVLAVAAFRRRDIT